MKLAVIYLAAWGALSGFAVGQSSWPNGPFNTSGAHIVDASNDTLKIAGVNWPGHGEVMIPEGLQHLSVEQIVSRITSIGLNGIRLTFATQMIDQIFANFGEDITLEQAFAWGLGPKNGSQMLEKVLTANPDFTKDTTRLQVYDAIAAECARQQVYIHLDNHMSTGKWCCSGVDGNGWWGDREFDAGHWARGNAYMVDHGKKWPSLVSLALRNEIRQPLENIYLRDQAYGWRQWYENMRIGADAVHAANEDVIIVFGGIGYAHEIDIVWRQSALLPGIKTWDRSDFKGYGNKIALEFHNYEHSHGNHELLRWSLYKDGFQGMNLTDHENHDPYPVMLTEFGHAMMPGEAYDKTLAFREVMRDYLPTTGAIWFHWVLVGDYYYRFHRNQVIIEEEWGLLNSNWTAWRNGDYIENYMKPMIKSTLA